MSSCGFQEIINKTITHMKKIFISIMAIAALAACNKEEAVEVQKGDAIAFGDAFVDNATKAIYENASGLTGFTVWGNVDGTNETPLALYGDAGATVSRNSKDLGVAWDCDVVRYWTPEAEYNFTAIANGTGTTIVNGIPTTISYTQNGADPADLVYGTAAAETNETCVPTGNVNGTIVEFTLRHLLARVKVQFENQIAAAGYTYDITNVKINTAKTGVYTIANAVDSDPATIAWDPADDEVALPYTAITGLAATVTPVGAQLIIPGAPVVLSFDYVLKLNGTAIYSTTFTKTVTTTLAEGNSYNLNVVLKAGNEIDFTLTALTDWTTDTPVTVE